MLPLMIFSLTLLANILSINEKELLCTRVGLSIQGAKLKWYCDENHIFPIEPILRANVSKGRESPDRTKKSNSILFYQKIPLGG